MKYWILASAVLLVGAAASEADAANSMIVEVGKTLAQEQCSSCHTVSGRGTGTDAVPTFASVAKRMNHDQLTAFLQGFRSKEHAKMPPVDLTNGQIDALTSYIESLK